MSERPILADCTDCGKTFKGCVCKDCSKCNTPFRCYLGTSIPKTRSHCRYCGAAICPSCLLSGLHPLKSCNPCHVAYTRKVQKGQDALISLTAESSGLQGVEDGGATTPVSPTMNLKDMSRGEQHIWMVEAVKKGNHPLISMLLDSGADVNLIDTTGNPVLFGALRMGHLACVALMMERGVDIRRTNSDDWTVLHVLGRYGATDQHVECCEMLVQMGADVFAKNSKGRTGLHLALRYEAHPGIVSSLRHAQVSQSVCHLQGTLAMPPSTSVRYGDLHRSIACLVDYMALPEEERSVSMASASFLLPPQLAAALDPVATAGESSAASTDDQASAPVLKRSAPPSLHPSPPDSPASRRPSPVPDRTEEFTARIRQLEAANRAAEARSQELVETVARSAQSAAQQVSSMRRQMEELKLTHQEAIERVEALHTNKTTKLRAEYDAGVFEANQRCQDAEQHFRDLGTLQQGMKLSWVPDEFVQQCMNTKCRAGFSQLVRRHHCRSCGRVFCKPCVAHCISLPSLGYEDPVKVCSSCFALVEDNFSKPARS